MTNRKREHISKPPFQKQFNNHKNEDDENIAKRGND